MIRATRGTTAGMLNNQQRETAITYVLKRVRLDKIVAKLEALDSDLGFVFVV